MPTSLVYPGTVTFPKGNIAPEGSVIKITAIDPEIVDDDDVYQKRGAAKMFIWESDALEAIKKRVTFKPA
jgi:dihydroxyacid dehydratase/phosphogluconate dehydratase